MNKNCHKCQFLHPHNQGKNFIIKECQRKFFEINHHHTIHATTRVQNSDSSINDFLLNIFQYIFHNNITSTNNSLVNTFSHLLQTTYHTSETLSDNAMPIFSINFIELFFNK